MADVNHSDHILNYTEWQYGLIYDKVLLRWFSLGQPVSVRATDSTVYRLKLHTMRPRVDGLTAWHRKNATSVGDTVRIEKSGESEILISVIRHTDRQPADLETNTQIDSRDAFCMEDLLVGQIDEANLIGAIIRIDQIMAAVEPKQIRRIVRQSIRNDTRIVELLKKVRNERCQFPGCQSIIKKKDGTNYVEVAHIEAVHRGGKSTLGNLLVLCPNHHKEFDLGDLKIEEQDPRHVSGTLNDASFVIDLAVPRNYGHWVNNGGT